MTFFSLKDIKKSSIYIIPDLPVIQTRRYRFSLIQLLIVLGLFSFIVAVGLIFILALTPLKNMLFVFESQEIEIQEVKIDELEHKISLLIGELNTVVSLNKKLEYAVYLAENDSIDSTDAVYDSLRKGGNEELIPYGGNISAAIRKFVERFLSPEDEDPPVFKRPVKGYVIKNFDPSNGHMGIDFAVKSGTPVYASSGGYIIFSGYTVDEGNMLLIEHENNYITVYKHCSVILKKTGNLLFREN